MGRKSGEEKVYIGSRMMGRKSRGKEVIRVWSLDDEDRIKVKRERG